MSFSSAGHLIKKTTCNFCGTLIEPPGGRLVTSNVVGPLSGVEFCEVKARTLCTAEIADCSLNDSNGSSSDSHGDQLQPVTTSVAGQRCWYRWPVQLEYARVTPNATLILS